MKNFRHNKAQVSTALNFLLKLMLFLVITGSAVYIFNNVALADIRAQNAARDLGAAFNVLALSAGDVTLEAECPSDVEYTIDSAKITARIQSMLGSGFASYSYAYESDATLPSAKIISCSSGQKIEIAKTYDSNLKPVITVK